jgi:hypothetical protein
VELGDIGGEGARSQLDSGALGEEEVFARGLGVGETVAEGVELEAEVAAPLLEVGVGPEEVDEGLAGVGMAGVVGEVSEKRRRLLAWEREGLRIPPGQAELAQQLNSPTSFYPLHRHPGVVSQPGADFPATAPALPGE